MKIRNALIASALGVLVLGSGAASQAASGDDEPTKEQLIANQKPLFPVDDGPVANPAQQALAERITQLVTPADENNRDKDGVPPQFADGIIGFTGSPAIGYTAVMGRDVDAASAANVVLESLPAEASKYLTTTISPRSTAELTQVWRSVRAYTWSPGGRLAYSLDVDPKTARIQLTTSGSPTPEDSDALQKIGGDALNIESGGKFARTSRTNDPPAHWGGARITRTGVGCSSGFTVRGKTTGTKYSLTAGHCGSNGQNWYSTSFFGEMAGKADYPDYDQARLKNSTYTNYLYTDGGDNFVSRLVTGANDSELHNLVCVSGAYNKSVCSIDIVSLTSTFCDSGGDCTTYLGKGQKPGSTVVVEGDSGGPVYLRNPSEARASVKGIVIAGGGDVVWWERYNSLSNHLNVTAVTSP